ncbi:hypothetical protein [Mechercharimyces sp. CAU 1602]|uniref:globin domain-containing protein n=1 Tax=Mechercharimyces sp. CAU 1602 TaxID=2973933 RepID=UPI00216343F3|nr:hypothetical protein [Mechercharimyces sp. CAU 1602]MCS1352396.1 hypothetical protein [Mechercharimyces sp. CAU 1602]
MSSNPNLYQQRGGEAFVGPLVKEFHERLLQDPKVKYLYQGIDMDMLAKRQALFIGFVLGGPPPQGGFKEDYGPLNAGDEQFEITIRHLTRVLRDHDVDLDHRVKVEAFLRSVKPFIVRN